WLTTLPWKVRRALEKEGKFPARIRISPNFVAWRLSEVQAWVKGEWKPG
ncbi:TPA: AlpA family phage regulatory protein, partial [Escherichia coli]|nr:AlpA family phage regulatory protein [Escherichia coli]HEL8126698.1 AlpA family phage regulatory protein [Escherichia coli]HEL8736559.1 AlpA family phage regulatory protein [Escherichia coli]HEL9997688.1 AlpA family phage regulatory protein [Escherichia coli]HEM0058949.1 AlpA family phage regulatory protein [Escherichia coli]